MAESASTTARILVVDDDAIVAESIAQSLTAAGYDASYCTSGDQAIQMIHDADRTDSRATSTSRLAGQGGASRQFSVMVIDMVMPGIGGLELMRRVRQTHRQIAPIIITGYGTIEAAVKSIRQGAIDYLTKPL